MEDEDIAPFCNTCYHELSARHFALTRRSEVMSMKLIDNQTKRAIEVICDEVLLQFCSFPCWQEKEPEIIDVWDLKGIYPVFAWTAHCSRCGKSVNRTLPYVTFNRCEIEVTEKPWMTIGKVFDDVELAVLCNDCCKPHQSATAEENEMDVIEEDVPLTASLANS